MDELCLSLWVSRIKLRIHLSGETRSVSAADNNLMYARYTHRAWCRTCVSERIGS